MFPACLIQPGGLAEVDDLPQLGTRGPGDAGQPDRASADRGGAAGQDAGGAGDLDPDGGDDFDAGPGGETDGGSDADSPGDGPSDALGEGSPVPDLARGLVLWLPFDESSGAANIRDQSANAHQVSLRGLDAAMAWVTGRIGGALDLGSVGAGGVVTGYVRAESSASLNRIGAQLTIAGWIWRGHVQPGVIVSRRASAVGRALYRVSVEADDHLRVLLNDRPGVRLNLRSKIPLPRDRWVHWAITCDSRATFYIDGQPAGAALYGVPFAPDNSPLLIGASDSGPRTNPIEGFLPDRLDEIVVYTRALAGSEVTALASGARPPVPAH